MQVGRVDKSVVADRFDSISGQLQTIEFGEAVEVISSNFLDVVVAQIQSGHLAAFPDEFGDRLEPVVAESQVLECVVL